MQIELGLGDDEEMIRRVSPGDRALFVWMGVGHNADTNRGRGSVTAQWPDPDAFIAELFHEHARSLVGLARLFVDNRDAAEDVVQESFIRLSRSLHRIEDPAKAVAYLRSIVLNLARDHNRRGLLSLRHTAPADDLDPASVDDTVASRDEHRRLLLALRELPRRQRDCVALRYLFELGVAEIAETLGLSPNSVKTHLKRGLAALRTHDREEWE